MSKKASLLDDVRATLPTRRGFQPWHEKLPPSLAAEVAEIKRQWRSGELATTKTALAIGLSKVLTARGVDIGRRAVLLWLEQN